MDAGGRVTQGAVAEDEGLVSAFPNRRSYQPSPHPFYALQGAPTRGRGNLYTDSRDHVHVSDLFLISLY